MMADVERDDDDSRLSISSRKRSMLMDMVVDGYRVEAGWIVGMDGIEDTWMRRNVSRKG